MILANALALPIKTLSAMDRLAMSAPDMHIV